jgi:hypothetical protein
MGVGVHPASPVWWPFVRSPGFWLLVVPVAYVVAQIALVGQLGLGWDESIYASQTDPRRPALAFGAPRARGMSLLAAPVQAVTSSTFALRACFAVLAGVGLYAAYAVWLRLRSDAAVPIAAFGLASLWLMLFYGPSLMPNVAVALAAVFATGALIAAARRVAPRWLAWSSGAAVALATLVRPGDVVPLVVAMVVVVLGHAPWRARSVELLGPPALGLTLGAIPWVVEAELRFGGTLARIRRAIIAQGTGERFVPDYQLRSVDGPLLCRPCNRAAEPIPPLGVVMWTVGTLLVVIAVWLALRRVRTASPEMMPEDSGAGRGPRPVDLTVVPPELTVVPAIVGASFAFPYLLLVGYAAPRFLVPAYALLALPAAQALVFLVRAAGGRSRLAASLGVAALLGAHLVVQLGWLEGVLRMQEPALRSWTLVARALARNDVRPPCLLMGSRSAPVGYVAKCDNADLDRLGGEPFTAADLSNRLRREQGAVVLRSGEPVPSYARGWRPIPRSALPGGWRVLVAPRPVSRGRSGVSAAES